MGNAICKSFLKRLSLVAGRFHPAMEQDPYYDRLQHALTEVEKVVGILEERVGTRAQMNDTPEIKRERRMRDRQSQIIQKGLKAKLKRDKLAAKMPYNKLRTREELHALAKLDREIESGERAYHRLIDKIDLGLDGEI